MADYLTENAVFTCNQGGIIKCEDSNNKSVSHNGAALLTTSATLKSKTGICQILLAAQVKPPLCKCQLTKWLPGFSPMKISNGNPLLTDSAKNFCNVGGSISVQFSGHVNKITTGTAPASMNIAAAQVVKVVNRDEKISAGEQNKNSAEVQSKSSSAEKIDTPENLDAPEKISAVAGISATSKKIEQGKLFCPFKADSERCKNCAYPKTATTIDNDAKKLFDNYRQYTEEISNRDAVDEHYYKMFEAYGKSRWSYQSHHIICGNQVFAPHVEIVRLANFFGYDINNALNCIRLVSREDDYGAKPGGKSASAYDIMSLSKIQWHLGGHSYKFSPKETERIKKRIRYFKKNGGDKILNYSELLSAELTKIESALTAQRVCKNDERQKKIFIERMNNLSRKVKAALGSFAEKPQQSFPFYVSKEAYTFAFALPQTAKIILIRRAEDKTFLFEKFRAERFDEIIQSEDGRKLLFKPILEKILSNPKKFSLDTRRSKIECVTFCENAEYFIFADDVNFSDVPFLTDEKFSKKLIGTASDGIKFLEDNESEILIWLRDLQDDYQYTAPKRKIKERLALIE
ncbi:MAG: AHH domain-containing protein [Selenomonadaceae bacterium]|nr:AHH domain-containing protein [Selenomonadaceae bacterium]